MAEIPTKPYLIRALYEWCVDSGYTPYISVIVDKKTLVPREFVRDGEIVLNISAVATSRLKIDNEQVSFQARFGGVARDLCVPIDNIQSIYARETGHGMAFDLSATSQDITEADETTPMDDESTAERPVFSVVSNETPEEPEPTTPSGRPKLTRIK